MYEINYEIMIVSKYDEMKPAIMMRKWNNES